MLADTANIMSCPEKDKWVILLMDEMHVKENLVFDKHTGIELQVIIIAHMDILIPLLCIETLTGFIDMGDINSHFSAYEKSLKSRESDNSILLANSMLVLMVKGLFSSFEFPCAQFPCSSITGSQLYTVFWEAVSRLELNGFRVLGLTCDGLAANRRLSNHPQSTKSIRSEWSFFVLFLGPTTPH